MFDTLREAFVAPSLAQWPIYLAALSILVVVAGIVLLWLRSRRVSGFERAMSLIAIERLSNVVLPKADDGDIHIDHILLTQRGILVVDIRDLKGIVFGSDKMRDWTVMHSGRRYTIPNPQEALLDRIAAIKLAVGQAPVDGRVVFGHEADFSKGTPSLVTSELALVEQWAMTNAADARALFDSAWVKLRDATFR